ncbi:MAG: hypothetical protein KDE15_05880 [Erythrobacter sp.]|nr:hypothetical protein [Erythrobacter sp.]
MFSERIDFLRKAIRQATPQVRRPALIGAAVFCALGVMVALGLSNTDNPLSMPSSLGGIAVSQAIWGLKPENLLMVLPIGAFLVVLARSFVGLKAFGLFTPMLIALAFLQIGPVFGPLVMVCAIGAGMVVTPSLLKLRMTRVGFLGVLISLVVFILSALQQVFDTELQVDAFPVVVTALCCERWWKQWDKDGAYEAAKLALNTFLLALTIEFVMVSHVALMLMDVSPMLLPGLCALAIAILGRYRGLRLSEIGRFLPIWYEGWMARLGLDGKPEARPEEIDEIILARAEIDKPHEEKHERRGVKLTVFPRRPPAPGQRPVQVPIGTNRFSDTPAPAVAQAPPEPQPLPLPDAAAIVPPILPPAVSPPAQATPARRLTAVDWDRVREELSASSPGQPDAQPVPRALPPYDAPANDGFSALFAHRGNAPRLVDPALLGFLDARGRHSAGRDPGDQPAQRDHRQVQPAQGDRAGARQGGDQGGAGGTRRGHHGHGGRGLRLWSA